MKREFDIVHSLKIWWGDCIPDSPLEIRSKSLLIGRILIGSLDHNCCYFTSTLVFMFCNIRSLVLKTCVLLSIPVRD
ncbi:hypothetical protein L1987_36832 [Smallanthus sonchifolius]|uniref:Uncharacterized protein n=1 Tax=Smallanthus sonchifolius TaxID=185202 RepID=A0ACB9HFI6_9ASTR|nr:hypothetical protein L1987_36832 [Smallanthus sonchifolius]